MIIHMHEKRHLLWEKLLQRTGQRPLRRVAPVPMQESRNPDNDCWPGPPRCRLLFNLGNQRPTSDDRRKAGAAIRHVIILHRNREGRLPRDWQGRRE